LIPCRVTQKYMVAAFCLIDPFQKRAVKSRLTSHPVLMEKYL
jgi:hypothetical protein